MLGYLFSVLGFLLFSAILVSGTIGFIFRDEIRQAIHEFKLQAEPITKNENSLSAEEIKKFAKLTECIIINSSQNIKHKDIIEFIESYAIIVENSTKPSTEIRKINTIKQNSETYELITKEFKTIKQNTAKKMPVFSYPIEIMA